MDKLNEDIKGFDFNKRSLLPPQANTKVGRPNVITPEIEEKIIEEITTTSKGLRVICSELGISYESMRRKIVNEPEFCASYTRAKKSQADHIVEEAIEIADEGVERGDMAGANIQKLRVETRLKVASYLNPRVYGKQVNEEIQVNVNHNINGQDEFNNIIELAKQKTKEIGEAANDNNITDAEYAEE
jgi:hypothetical protein